MSHFRLRPGPDRLFLLTFMIKHMRCHAPFEKWGLFYGGVDGGAQNSQWSLMPKIETGPRAAL
jgi:hypothetical protein